MFAAVKSRELRVESQKAAIALRSCCGTVKQGRPRLGRPTRGFTLVELLVVILILSILAALVLGVAAVAAETARQAQTKHIVERLHTLLMEHYNTLKTRRVGLRRTVGSIPGIPEQIEAKFPTNPRVQGQALAEARLYAFRELVLMEVPDRWSDILLTDVGTPSVSDDDQVPPLPAASAEAPLYLANRPGLSGVFLRRYASLVGRINTVSGSVNTAGDIKRNQGAECLYMIVTLACGDGEARSQFKDADIGDIDGDGAPEFLDGWGRPINFLRWAPGFDSQLTLNANQLQTTDSSASSFWPVAAAKDHDPFDVFRCDLYAYRLVPLIYSPGRNESSGLVSDPGHVTWRPKPLMPTITFNNSSPYIAAQSALNPYQKVGTPAGYIGTDIHLVDPANFPETTSTDNIHNHLMGLR